MIKKDLKNLQEKDLYSSRRKENKTELFLLKSNKPIALLGIIFGGASVFVILACSLLLFFQSLFLKNKNLQLQIYVDAFDKFQSEINKIKIKNQEIKFTNKRLVNDLLNIKSGSTILAELRLLIPKFISLNSLNLDKNSMEIKGTVNQKNGLKNINVFIIKINESDFFIPKATKLIQVKEIENNNKNSNLKRLNFVIKAELVDKFEEINKDKLNELGSPGIAKRIKMIKDRGIIK